MKNWKTTLFGGLAAICGFMATQMPDWAEVLGGLAAVFTALMAFFAKDSNVTGGTTPQ